MLISRVTLLHLNCRPCSGVERNLEKIRILKFIDDIFPEPLLAIIVRYRHSVPPSPLPTLLNRFDRLVPSQSRRKRNVQRHLLPHSFPPQLQHTNQISIVISVLREKLSRSHESVSTF